MNQISPRCPILPRIAVAFLPIIVSFGLQCSAAAQTPNDPPELQAVEHGVRGIEAFAKSGGKFTNQKNSRGQTAAMLAAASTPAVIEAFHRAGGVFTDDKDVNGRTAAMYVVAIHRPCPASVAYYKERARAITAFAHAGGHFTAETDRKGMSSITLVMENPLALLAFRKAGGVSPDTTIGIGNMREIMAIYYGVESIRSFVADGYIFTSLRGLDGKTAGEFAATRPPEVYKAYKDAVAAQGGLAYVTSDDEYSALRDICALQDYVRAGGQFDDKPNIKGLTAEVLAVWGGPKIVDSYSENGGLFTNRINAAGLNSGDLAAQEESQHPGLLAAWQRAVKRQGGLVLIPAKDEYEAIRMGPATIEFFVRSGGRFDEKPNDQDLTPAMLAVINGPETIEAFGRAGGHFTDWQNRQGYTAAMAATYYGADAITAFARAGGRFTDQQNHRGNTAAMIVAMRQDDTFPDGKQELHFPGKEMKGGALNQGASAIDAFHAAGGQFTDQQNWYGRTAAMYAVQNSPEAVLAFARAGGHFTDQEDKAGFTDEIYAVTMDPAIIRAFAQAGGHFTTRRSSTGLSSEFAAAQGTADQITAYSEAGGIFTDRKSPQGWTSAMLASDMAGWMSRSMTANLKQEPENAEARAARAWLLQQVKNEYHDRDIAAAKAYREAVRRQGGLRHIS